jgi:hypothetical protein
MCYRHPLILLEITFIGIDDPNTYNVEFSKSGYFTDTLQITLTSGDLVTQNVKLLPKNSFSKDRKSS